MRPDTSVIAYIVLAAPLALCCASSAEPPPCYEITAVLEAPVCGLFGPGGIGATSLNANNMVLGHWAACPFDDVESFLWTIDGGFDSIPWPSTAFTFEAFDLNDEGIVVGTMNLAGDEIADREAFVYEDGTLTGLGTIPGGNFSTGSAINNFGHVAGSAGNTWDDPPNAVAWINGKIVDIGVLLPGNASLALDINDLDRVVGYTGSNPLVYQRGFYWDDGRAVILDTVPGGTSSKVTAVNNRGQAIGYGFGEQVLAHPVSIHVWKGFLWESGRFTPIDAPGYIHVLPHDINDDGIVVGQLGDAGTSSELDHGFVWRGGILRDINALVEIDPDIVIVDVPAVNEAGVVVANAKSRSTDEWMILLLTPKAPNPADLTGDCTVNGEDLAMLLLSWGPVGKRNANPAADLDGNGVVNGFDLAMLLAAWG